MIIWSTFILDEMAGLRNDALPTCPECKKDPGFLAKNSGVVTAIQGPSGSAPATFGEVTSWTIAAEARRRGRGLRRVRDDRRLRALDRDRTRGQGAGALRARVGIDRVRRRVGLAWTSASTPRRRSSEFYGQDVIDALTAGTDTLSRWAISQGQGDLLGAIQGEQPVANAVNEVSQRHRPGRRRLAGRRRDP